MEKHSGEATQCCPKFDPEPWNDKEITWKDKLFIKDSIAIWAYWTADDVLLRVRGDRACG